MVFPQVIKLFTVSTTALLEWIPCDTIQELFLEGFFLSFRIYLFCKLRSSEETINTLNKHYIYATTGSALFNAFHAILTKNGFERVFII